MEVLGAQEVDSFRGAYTGSKKEPDVLFKYHQPNGDVSYSAVVEIGFAQRYQDLIEDVKLWIEGNKDIRTAILIKIDEDPLYRSPTSKMDDDQILQLGFPPFTDLKPSMVVYENPDDSFGPLQLNNLPWVNKMSIFVEIWKKDETNNAAKQHGPRMVSHRLPLSCRC